MRSSAWKDAGRSLVVAALAWCLVAVHPAGAAGQEAIVVVRHAEQANDGTRDPSLSEAGVRRALALAALLADVGITAIYTSELARTRETAAPLAERLGLPIQPVAQAPFDEGFVDRLRREHPEGRVLIVGHSNTVPELLRLVGHREAPEIDAGDHGNLFVVVPGASGPPTVLRLRLAPPE